MCFYLSAFAVTVIRFNYGIIKMLKFEPNKINNANIKNVDSLGKK